jgi:hypothetical protein
MRLKSPKLILKDFFVLCAHVEPIYLRLNRDGAHQSFHLNSRMQAQFFRRPDAQLPSILSASASAKQKPPCLTAWPRSPPPSAITMLPRPSPWHRLFAPRTLMTSGIAFSLQRRMGRKSLVEALGLVT